MWQDRRILDLFGIEAHIVKRWKDADAAAAPETPSAPGSGAPRGRALR